MHRLRLFVAEDNEADLHWLKTVLDGMGIAYHLTAVTDGEEAVEFLLKHGQYAKRPDPDLIILDLNLPKVKGIDVLKAAPHSDQLPVCIVTGSAEEREILKKAFGIRRIAYLIKPVDRDRILNAFRAYDHLRPLAEELSAATRPSNGLPIKDGRTRRRRAADATDSDYHRLRRPRRSAVA